MHYVLRSCLQAVHRCPGNTDGGWRARIQKTINLWQQLQTEISRSFCPGFSQRRSLFPHVHPLCPRSLVFYLIPTMWAGPVRTGPDRSSASAQLLVALPHLLPSAQQPCTTLRRGPRQFGAHRRVQVQGARSQKQ